jgi:ABC-type antimicrobial peptide transport system permease subunit
MVNEAFVRRFWPAGSPVGRRIAVGKRPMTVVGVAADGRYDYRTIEDPPPPLVYYALRQMPSAFVTLHARTIPAPLEVAPAIREVMIAVDPDLTTLPPLPLDTYTTLPMTPSRAGVMLLGILGAVGLVLSAMGVHAVIAFSVATRRREIGIRLALGASPRRVFGAFVRQALVLAAIGVMAGVVCASAASSALRRLLDRLPQVDFDAMIWPGVLLLIVALASASIPAVRAARVDPARTLRSE